MDSAPQTDYHQSTPMVSPTSSTDAQQSDAPVTPPSSNGTKIHPFASMSSAPPHAPRHERPINRRLYLQEAQERLSLPDLFAPRSNTTTTNNIMTPNTLSNNNTIRRTRAVNTHLLIAMHQQQQSQNRSFRIHPKAVPWGDFWDNASHNMSQRCVINPDDAI